MVTFRQALPARKWLATRSVFGVQALVVIGQDLDHTAFADAAMPATADHGLQLFLQLLRVGAVLCTLLCNLLLMRMSPNRVQPLVVRVHS